MNLKELLQKTFDKGYYDSYTLMIQHYGKLEGEFLEREYYTDTPIFDKCSPISEDSLNKYIVLVPFYWFLDIGRNWRCPRSILTVVVTTMEELLKHYSNQQLTGWLEWLDEEVRKEVLIHTL